MTTNEKKEQSIRETMNSYVEKINQAEPNSPEAQKLVEEFASFVADSIKSIHDIRLESISKTAKAFKEEVVPFKQALNAIKDTMKESQKEGDLSSVSDSEIEQVVRDIYNLDSELPF